MHFLFTCLPLITRVYLDYDCYLNVALLTDDNLSSYDHMVHATTVTRCQTYIHKRFAYTGCFVIHIVVENEKREKLVEHFPARVSTIAT